MFIEQQVLLGIQQIALASPWTITLVVFFARWCIFLNVLPALFLVYSRSPKRTHAVIEALWSAGCALFITTLIALIVQRDRPFIQFQEIQLLIPAPLTTAFPSGHTSTAIAIACALFRVNRTAGLFSLVVAGFVIFGRMAVGVHVPTDIIGGIFVGTLAFGIVRITHQEMAEANSPRETSRHHHT
jgi:undecaprenyl-diphosphatase